MNGRDACLMCHGPGQLRRAGLDLALGAPVCCGHGWQFGEMAREDRRRHPDGHCTTACGCVSFDELKD